MTAMFSAAALGEIAGLARIGGHSRSMARQEQATRPRTPNAAIQHNSRETPILLPERGREDR